jgi:hypothetical protein
MKLHACLLLLYIHYKIVAMLLITLIDIESTFDKTKIFIFLLDM